MATELTACEKLKLAELQLDALITGKSVSVIETPQLGRVEFSAANMDDLQRLIAGLKRECAAELGITNYGARKPISVEVDP